ncbi:hypothetical protein KR200_009400 [Drosophila serrata]|nr:hypothetical protein KR200_009400 [Drosophila serrata]
MFHSRHQAGSTQMGQTRPAGHRNVGRRQAGNVRSYKDEQDSEDDEDELVGTGESLEDSPDGAYSDFKSNVTQINYEMDDFNKTYCDESSPWQNESSYSPQWRRHNANTARPNVGQRNNVKSRLDLNFKNRWNKRNKNQRPPKNNEDTIHNPGLNQNYNRGQQQQQSRLMLQERMRFAYNSFRDNNVDQSPNVLINHKKNFHNIPQNPPDMGYPSTITSMIDSVNNLADRRAYGRYETTMPPLTNGYAAERAKVNTLPQPGNPMELNSSATDEYTVQQVARHVMLMMSTVRNIDTQETPEYFKVKLPTLF